MERTGDRRNRVPVAVWEINKQDEANLDVYEGVKGGYYTKEIWPVIMKDGSQIEGMIYIMKMIRQSPPMERYYVELLINTVKKCIAIRPCEQDNPNAIRWARLKKDRWAVRRLSCRGLSQVLVDVMDWIYTDKYQMVGRIEETEDGKVLLFNPSFYS